MLRRVAAGFESRARVLLYQPTKTTTERDVTTTTTTTTTTNDPYLTDREIAAWLERLVPMLSTGSCVKAICELAQQFRQGRG